MALPKNSIHSKPIYLIDVCSLFMPIIEFIANLERSYENVILM